MNTISQKPPPEEGRAQGPCLPRVTWVCSRSSRRRLPQGDIPIPDPSLGPRGEPRFEAHTPWVLQGFQPVHGVIKAWRRHCTKELLRDWTWSVPTAHLPRDAFYLPICWVLEAGAERRAEAAGCGAARGWRGVTTGWMSHAASPEVINDSG